MFSDEQPPGDLRSSSRGRGEMNLFRINLMSNNVNAASVVACGQGTMSGPSPARLTAPQVLHHSDTPDQRSMEIDLSQSLTNILASIHGVNKDPQAGMNVISSCTDAWMAAMKARQNSYEEQLGRLQDSVVTLNITMQRAESLYKELQENIEDLKSNSSEVWQRLGTEERRLDVLDKAISTVEYNVEKNLETVREWFIDLTAQSSPEIHREIVNSIQEVINDSFPGIAVDRMRDYKNPVGMVAYSVFKNLCIIERNKSEGSRQPEKISSPKMKPRSPKSPRSPRPKSKSAHKVMETTEDELDEIQDSTDFATSYHNTKWYLPNLRFPCPLRNHKHKISTCPEFFSFSPAERWNKMDKGKLCYACLAPKDVCTGRKCNFEDKAPETLKCQGCVPNAQSKNLAPFSILFC